MYMDIAISVAERSHCERAKVGAVLVDESFKNIISFGFNGTPSGFENVCEIDPNTTKPEVLHAESNAIAKVARSTMSSESSVLFITLSPCFECAKLIIQAGIKSVFFKEAYGDLSGVELLIKARVNCTQL